MCEHENFVCHADIARLSQVEGGPITHYCVDVTIKCTECGERFEFVGVPMGLSFYHPTVNLDRTELRAPLMPRGRKTPEGLPGYSVQFRGEGKLDA